MSPLFGFGEFMLSPSHLVLILVAGVVLFGKRLPEIGRYVGKGIVEFKKGLKGLEDEVDGAVSRPESVALPHRLPLGQDIATPEYQHTSPAK